MEDVPSTDDRLNLTPELTMYKRSNHPRIIINLFDDSGILVGTKVVVVDPTLLTVGMALRAAFLSITRATLATLVTVTSIERPAVIVKGITRAVAQGAK